jgi:DNA-binding PucR family transcriptional regulator
VAELAARAAAGSVAIVVPRLAVAVISDNAGPQADELLAALGAWVAEPAHARPAAVPGELLAQVPVCLRDEVAGVVALLDDGRPVARLAPAYVDAAAVAALMEVAVQDARETTEQELRGSFLEELRSRETLDTGEIVRRAERLGCDLRRGGVVLGSTLTSERAHQVIATIVAEHPGAIAQTLETGDEDPRPRVYAVLPATLGADPAGVTLAAARGLAERLRRHAIVGLSSFRADPAELGEAMREAEMVLEVLRHSEQQVADEIGDGTYRLLFRMIASHPEEIRTFYETTVAVLVRYDDQYNTELIRTLHAYLGANCNMNATAAAIFAHRHTVAYRLERIQELTGLDPTLSDHRERLGIGLKIHRIVAPRAAALRPRG